MSPQRGGIFVGQIGAQQTVPLAAPHLTQPVAPQTESEGFQSDFFSRLSRLWPNWRLSENGGSLSQ